MAEKTEGSVGRGRLPIPSLYTIGFVSIIVAIFFRSIALEIDGDLWWHLGNGQRMFEMREVRLPEWMSFTFAGQRFVNQWWLGELILYGLYSAFGLWSIFVVTSGAIAASFVFVYLRMLRRGSIPSVALTLLTLGAIASSVSWGTRPQMISLLFTSGFLWLMDEYDRTGSSRWLLPMPLLMLLWCNIHGAFVIGIALLAIYALAAWIEREGANARHLTITLLATSVASVASPNGILQWQYPLEFFFPNPYLNLIAESLSPDFHLRIFLLFEILLILLIVSALWAPRRRWREILLIIGFTHLALSQIRHIALWVIALAPLIAEYSSAALRDIGEQRPMLVRINKAPSEAMRAVVNVLLILAIGFAYAGVFSRVLTGVDLKRTERQRYPAAAADHIESTVSPERTFTTFEWGGYLSWRLYPRQTVFIDARADSIYDERVLMDYVTIMGLFPGWRQRTDDWKIDQFVIERGSDLDHALAKEASWERSYADHNAVIYVRRSASP